MEALILTVIAVAGRLLPHPANFTPVGAVALVSGWRLGMKKGVMVTVTSMLVTDFFLGLHPVMWATYGSLVFGVLLGRLIFGRSVGALLLVYSLISSVVFYLVTNFAVWILPGSMYPHTPEGLLTSYILALPFFRNSLIADFFYMTVFLAGYIAFGNVRRIGGSAAITIPQTTQNRPSELEDS